MAPSTSTAWDSLRETSTWLPVKILPVWTQSPMEKVAGKLTSHTQLLASAELTDGVFGRNQLAKADKNEPAAQPGLTPDTEEPVQARPYQKSRRSQLSQKL